MNRNVKSQLIDSMKEEIENAKGLILMKYQGITVESFTKLRRSLGKEDASIRVVKNTLFKRAIKDSPLSCLARHLEGPVAVAYAWKSPVSLAKIILDAIKENSSLGIKAGYISGKELTYEDIKILGTLPPIEYLKVKLLSLFKSSTGRFLGVLIGAHGNFLGVLTARSKKI